MGFLSEGLEKASDVLIQRTRDSASVVDGTSLTGRNPNQNLVKLACAQTLTVRRLCFDRYFGVERAGRAVRRPTELAMAVGLDEDACSQMGDPDQCFQESV